MCRDIFGAQIIGKNSKYPVANFDFGEGLSSLVKWLDAREKTIVYRHKQQYEIEVDNTGKPVRKIYDDGRVEEP